jgi:hypothetical protein
VVSYSTRGATVVTRAEVHPRCNPDPRYRVLVAIPDITTTMERTFEVSADSVYLSAEDALQAAAVMLACTDASVIFGGGTWVRPPDCDRCEATRAEAAALRRRVLEACGESDG